MIFSALRGLGTSAMTSCGDLSDDVRVGELPQSLNDDGIPRLAQPALEQSTNEIIRLDDQYATLLLHDIRCP